MGRSTERPNLFPDKLFLEPAGEDVWIDVIRKMDDVYSDLVNSQTELEGKNAQLEEADAFIRSVLGAMTDVLIVCDAKGRIQQVNPALVDLTGLHETALIGTAFTEIFADGEREKALGFLKAVIAGKDVVQQDVELVSGTGAPAPISLTCTVRRDQKGHPAGMVMVGRPIGELQRAYHDLDVAHEKLTRTQQQLLVSEKMAALGRLVAGVAHELNNPISFVFGNMYALKRYGTAIKRYLTACDSGTPQERQAELRKELKIEQIVEDIGPLVDGTLEGAERVRDIVQDLRRFSSNQQEAAETFNVVRLIHTAADWVIKAQRIKPDLVFDVPERLDVTGRKGQIHQILVNLVQNAADVLDGRTDGRICISCRHENCGVTISVADNGTGLSPEVTGKLFEPFFTTKPIGTGTGLGLYISYTMAEKQGGSLEAANLSEGGAIFTLRIPDHDPSSD